MVTKFASTLGGIFATTLMVLVACLALAHLGAEAGLPSIDQTALAAPFQGPTVEMVRVKDETRLLQGTEVATLNDWQYTAFCSFCGKHTK